MTDEVFSCKKNHVFHTVCYEDRALDTEGQDEISDMLNKCPTCGSLMNITVDQEKANSNNSNRVRFSIN